MMLCVAALAGGCATPAVWEVKTCHPANNPNLSLAFDPKSNDLLVKYDEQRASSKSVQTRFYWLLANNNQPKNQPPHFIDEVNLPDLISVPVIEWVVTNSVPETGYSAKMLLDQRSFCLYRDGVIQDRFFLPNYPSPIQMKTVSRVMLTPPAVIADTAISVYMMWVYAAASSTGTTPSF